MNGESEALGEEGGSVFIESPGGGGFLQDGKGRGAGRVSAANPRLFFGGVGGLNIVFGAEMSTKLCFAPWILVVFVISVLSVISANPAINSLACDCLSCLRHFRDSRRFREKHRIAKHRFGKT